MTSRRVPAFARVLRSPAFVTGAVLLAFSLLTVVLSLTLYGGNPLTVASPPFIEPGS
ncbi:hypothetical protein [Xylophilus sp.]|uniref:hypothetical protein n=1 Tax=Xylophilus sp. TaxID=2653893 RepID=UPI0013BD9946|nr:hypothetical protein [Xylophilus sp.]KAF1044496.1 MAG: hypothetical protein GAK38_03529 [Xylophilus sp.]